MDASMHVCMIERNAPHASHKRVSTMQWLCCVWKKWLHANVPSKSVSSCIRYGLMMKHKPNKITKRGWPLLAPSKNKQKNKVSGAGPDGRPHLD